MNHSDNDNSINWEQTMSQYEMSMHSETNTMQIEAIMKIAHISKHAPERLLVNIIPHLIENLKDYHSIHSCYSLQKASVYCLKCIACRGDGGLATKEVAKCGAANCLLWWLSHSSGMFQQVVTKCLLLVVTFCSSSRAVVYNNGGVDVIVGLLDSCDGDLRLYLLEILSALALLRDVRRALIRLGSLKFLVEAASCGSMVSKERACQAIGLLGVTRQVRRTLVELGVIPVLVECLRDGDHAMKLVAGNVLGVISAHTDYIRLVSQSGVIGLYAELLQGHDPSGKEIAEDVLCILAVAEENAVEIIGHLVRILREGENESKASAADVLWDLVSYRHVASMIRESGVIPILVELLCSMDEEIKQNVSGACAQLSYDKADRMALAEEGAIPILIEMMLHDELEDVRDNAAEALVNFAEDPLYYDRVSDAISAPSFRDMQDRLLHIRAANDHMATSLRRMTD